MANVVIIHGNEGHPGANWFPWLKEELENDGHMVFVPQFPGGEEQVFDEWMNVFKKYDSYLGENTLFVGHSLGVSFILGLLETYPAKAAFLVGGFVGKLSKEYNAITKTFSERTFDFEKIQKQCKSFYLFHGKDDDVVPVEKAEELKKLLNAELRIIDGGGHLDEAAGYYQFDVLLEKMKEVL